MFMVDILSPRPLLSYVQAAWFMTPRHKGKLAHVVLVLLFALELRLGTSAQNRPAPHHTMFAGRSVERLVPTSVLPKGETVWACETIYRFIGPGLNVNNDQLRNALDQVWEKINSLPNLKITLEITTPEVAHGTQEHTCSSDDEREECRMLSNEFAANYDAVDLHVFSGITRSTQFPEIGEKEWTYNRMLETSLRDRGFFGRVVSLRLMVLREGIHVMKYLPLTPLYAEETLFQLCGRDLLPFDITKQNALYASLDLIGLNNLAGVGWVEIVSVSEAWHWKPSRGDVGVANITIRTQRDRTGSSMGEYLSPLLPRLFDRLDEIGLPRVDGEILWSRFVDNRTPQDQIARQLSPDDPVRAYDIREPSSTIKSYPRRGNPLWGSAAIVTSTILATFGGLFCLSCKRQRKPVTPPPPPQPPLEVSMKDLKIDKGPPALKSIYSIPSQGAKPFSPIAASIMGINSLHPNATLARSATSGAVATPIDGQSFNPFKTQRSTPNLLDADIKTTGDSATDPAGTNSGVTKDKRRANIQADLAKAASLRGWEISIDNITFCKHEDGRYWLLGHGGFGEVYKGLKSDVQDVAVKVLTHPEELMMQQFEVEIELLKGLSFDHNIVQFYGCVMDAPHPMLILELMEGGDLRSALSGPMAAYNNWYENGQVLAMDIVRGIFYLHDNKVIHGDLKSKNVLLSRNCGTAKLSDVGMSRVLASTFVTGDFNQLPQGTFAYAAPELLLGQRCTLMADIFSLGVTLWEICTHDVPVRGRMRPLRVPEDCPQAISDLIDQCLQAQPEDRPTAKEVFQALQAARNPTLRTSSSASSGSFPSRVSVQRMQRAMLE